ncbi:hypothetical protein H5410_034788, partial [Solanum commersonii]
MVYRISTMEEWELMQKTGSTCGGDLDRTTGFIHLKHSAHRGDKTADRGSEPSNNISFNKWLCKTHSLAKNKPGFIIEHILHRPQHHRDPQPLGACNDTVTSWLLNSLSKEIAHAVIYSRTAKELDESRARFGQSN